MIFPSLSPTPFTVSSALNGLVLWASSPQVRLLEEKDRKQGLSRHLDRAAWDKLQGNAHTLVFQAGEADSRPSERLPGPLTPRPLVPREPQARPGSCRQQPDGGQ